MPLDLTDDKSTLVQVMAWCRQATLSHNELKTRVILQSITLTSDSPICRKKNHGSRKNSPNRPIICRTNFSPYVIKKSPHFKEIRPFFSSVSSQIPVASAAINNLPVWLTPCLESIDNSFIVAETVRGPVGGPVPPREPWPQFDLEFNQRNTADGWIVYLFDDGMYPWEDRGHKSHKNRVVLSMVKKSEFRKCC